MFGGDAPQSEAPFSADRTFCKSLVDFFLDRGESTVLARQISLLDASTAKKGRRRGGKR